MQTTDYIDSAQEVRSALGASPKELKDEQILGPTLLTELLERLAGVSSDLDDVYQAIKVLDPQTKDQARFVRLVKAFATYTLARLLVPVMPMLAPKRITDGKAEKERVDNPYELLIPDLDMQLGYVRKQLLDAYQKTTGNQATSVTSARVLADNVGLGTDPITG
jgi:hypothetical protein